MFKCIRDKLPFFWVNDRASQGKVEAKLVKHVWITPDLEHGLLVWAQTGDAALFQFHYRRGLAQVVKIPYQVSGKPL